MRVAAPKQDRPAHLLSWSRKSPFPRIRCLHARLLTIGSMQQSPRCLPRYRIHERPVASRFVPPAIAPSASAWQTARAAAPRPDPCRRRRRSGLDTRLVPESFPTGTAFVEGASLLRSTVDVVPRRVIERRAAVIVDGVIGRLPTAAWARRDDVLSRVEGGAARHRRRRDRAESRLPSGGMCATSRREPAVGIVRGDDVPRHRRPRRMAGSTDGSSRSLDRPVQAASTADLIRSANAGASLTAALVAKPTISLPDPCPSNVL
jgi:hypothetical protein